MIPNFTGKNNNVLFVLFQYEICENQKIKGRTAQFKRVI